MSEHLTQEEFEEEYFAWIIKYWEGYSKERAIYDMYEHIGARFGNKRYSWSADSARDLAISYMSDYGEAIGHE